ncbi:MAG: nickel pincer cofactor biosynthesis protein LarC [Phycisphaerales bacterium]|jgi:pyridinium-3,5-bisthiocarboxylic acid mononucleotide nickel chelatase|nr:nickel pincer cofactor biosynthesis protein LarC [Phycisphaerales bacterium]
MTVAYFDCFAGAGGDMIVASLLDAGCDIDALRTALSSLDLDGYSLATSRAARSGISGTKFDVLIPHHHHDHHHDHDEDGEHAHHHPHRGLKDCLDLIDGANLPARAAARASEIFTRLAQAEAQVHGCTINQVHFHEVGAVDSIIDIVGACLAMEQLDIDQIFCSVIPVGSGTIQCQHGTIPAPAPATAELLRGFKTRQGPINGEMTTPTAAAILTTLSGELGPMPAMDVASIGYGAGTRDSDQLPNLLRVYIGELSGSGSGDTVVELTVNLDDCTGEIIGATIDKLLLIGCLDAWAAPIVMKKSRPAWQLSVLCDTADVNAAEDVLLTETTSFGVRKRTCTRTKLNREFQTVTTPFGPINIKIGRRGGTIVTAGPEFEDCRQAAQSHGTPVRKVMDAARAAFDKEGPRNSNQKGRN